MQICSCGATFAERMDFDEHQRMCSRRSYVCELCNEEVPSTKMSLHLFHCASKTNQCPKCQRYIQRSIYNYHLESNCTIRNEDGMEDIHEQILDREPTVETKVATLIPCEFCQKPIQWSDFEFHANSCSQRNRTFNSPRSIRDYSTDHRVMETKRDTTINATTTERFEPARRNDEQSSRENAASRLHSRTATVRDSLSKEYYPNEVNHVAQNLQFNIIVIGSPRVGKSQLINALCGDANLAKTSPGLNSCTTEVKCYTLKNNQQTTPGIEPFQINIFDTPGIESWTEQNGELTMLKFIEEKNPISVIFCASPGCFADIAQLRPILKLCQKRQIFCALVCTNMWSNSSRTVVIEEFRRELTLFGESDDKFFDQGTDRSAHLVTVFGHGALCTMVNSIEYYFPDLSPIRKPVQGVDELIQCIMNELDQEKLLGWCCAVLYRRSFWQKVSHKINGFYCKKFASIQHLFSTNKDQTALQIIKHLFSKSP